MSSARIRFKKERHKLEEFSNTKRMFVSFRKFAAKVNIRCHTIINRFNNNNNANSNIQENAIYFHRIYT